VLITNEKNTSVSFKVGKKQKQDSDRGEVFFLEETIKGVLVPNHCEFGVII